MLRRLLAGLWLVALAALLGAVTRQTRGFAERDRSLTAPPPFSRLDTRLLNVVTLGHRGVYDDFAAIWLLQMLVDERIHSENPDNVARTIETVVRHAPKLESIYMASCFALTFDLKRPEACEKITLVGLKAFPDSWRIPVTQGFVYAYKLNDAKNAALYYGLAASRPGSPEFLKPLTAHLAEKNGLSVEDLQMTVDRLLDTASGSRFADFLKALGKSQPQYDKGQ